jgi:hypothetical protein
VFEPLVGECGAFPHSSRRAQRRLITPAIMGAGEADVARQQRVRALFGMLVADEGSPDDRFRVALDDRVDGDGEVDFDGRSQRRSAGRTSITTTSKRS